MTGASNRFEIPYLMDRHCHPLFYASCIDGVALNDVQTKSECVERLVASQKPVGEISVATGWIDSRFNLTREDLKDAGAVAVFNLSLHGVVLSAEAYELLLKKIGPAVDRWSDQRWFETNLNEVWNCFAKLNGTVDRLQRYFDWLRESHGVVYAEELLLVGEHEIDLFEQAGLIERTRFWSSPATWETLSPAAREKVEGLKLFTDGALGVRTAAVHQPYLTGGTGMLLYTDDQLTATLQGCFATRKSLAIHAIGDRAIDQVVDTLEKVLAKAPHRPPTLRIEHAQLITAATARRAKSLGIVLSMQPNFSDDSSQYVDRLPDLYLQGNNPFRMLIDTVGYVPGDDLIFGSDGMPHGARFALQQSLFPPFENQRMTLDEFVAGYCDPNSDDRLGFEIVGETVDYQ